MSGGRQILLDTVIGDPGGIEDILLTPPVLLNTHPRALSPWILEAFGRALCAGA